MMQPIKWQNQSVSETKMVQTIAGAAWPNRGAAPTTGGADRGRPPNEVRHGTEGSRAETTRQGDRLVRLATLVTTSGPRLHVRAHGGGYVDIGEATGEGRVAAFESFVAVGPAAMEAARHLQDRGGREYPLSDSVRRCPRRSASCASA